MKICHPNRTLTFHKELFSVSAILNLKNNRVCRCKKRRCSWTDTSGKHTPNNKIPIGALLIVYNILHLSQMLKIL